MKWLTAGWLIKMGDETAKWLGRLTLNPVKHIDPIGSLMLLVVGFGWAKPVPVNLENIPAPQRRKGLILVSAAGATANIIIAFCALLVWRLMSPAPGSMMYNVLYLLANINILLAAFNLIPIPPLDGSKILMSSAGVVQPRIVSNRTFWFFYRAGSLLTEAIDPRHQYVSVRDHIFHFIVFYLHK